MWRKVAERLPCYQRNWSGSGLIRWLCEMIWRHMLCHRRVRYLGKGGRVLHMLRWMMKCHHRVVGTLSGHSIPIAVRLLRAGRGASNGDLVRRTGIG